MNVTLEELKAEVLQNPEVRAEYERLKTMTKEQQQRIRVVLAAAIEALKAIDPYLDADSLERSSLARHCIRWVLRELGKPEDDGDA